MTIARTPSAVLAACAALVATSLVGASPPATNTAGAVEACGNSSLAVSHTAAHAATGHGSFVLLFKNTSRTTCSIYGYPGFDALNASGHILAHARRTLQGFAGGAHKEKTVAVIPGHWASATSEWTNFNPANSGSCTFSKSVATTPANTTHTIHLAVSVSVCVLQVHPTVAGTSGSN
jgi:hypothetical protein